MLSRKEVFEIKQIDGDKVKTMVELHLVTDNKYEWQWKMGYGEPKLTLGDLKLISESLLEVYRAKSGQAELPGVGDDE